MTHERKPYEDVGWTGTANLTLTLKDLKYMQGRSLIYNCDIYKALWVEG